MPARLATRKTVGVQKAKNDSISKFLQTRSSKLAEEHATPHEAEKLKLARIEGVGADSDAAADGKKVKKKTKKFATVDPKSTRNINLNPDSNLHEWISDSPTTPIRNSPRIERILKIDDQNDNLTPPANKLLARSPKAPKKDDNIYQDPNQGIEQKFSKEAIESRLTKLRKLRFPKSPERQTKFADRLGDSGFATVEKVKLENVETILNTESKIVRKSVLIDLPKNFSNLLDVFKCLDRSLIMHHNSGRDCYFADLKKTIQSSNMPIKFDLKLFKQIIHISPSLFSIDVAKASKYTSNLQSYYDYIISPKTESCTQKATKISPQGLISRLDTFSHDLLSVAHHKQFEFFKRMFGPDIDLPPVESIRRFHPEFENEPISDLEMAILPNLPSASNSKTTSSALKILKNAEKNLNSEIEDSILSQKSLNESENNFSTADESKNREYLLNNTIQSNLSMINSSPLSSKLLAKVRQKESRKSIENILMDPQELERRKMQSKLEDFVKKIHDTFLVSRKQVMAVDVILRKLVDSKVNQYEAQKLLDLALKEFPKWIKVIECKGAKFLREDQAINIFELLNKRKNSPFNFGA